MKGIHICSFSTGIDEMKRADQKDPAKVLAVLKQNPRYSTFEVTANQGIARTITLLHERGCIKTVGGAYPWTVVEILPAGDEVLAGGAVPEKPNPATDFVRTSKRDYVHKAIAEKYGLKEYIPPANEKVVYLDMKKRRISE